MTEHPDRDDLVALALGHLDADQAEEVAAHLMDCSACRAAFDGYADSIAMLLPASPRTAPPPGFSARVLDRMGGARQGSRPRGAPAGRRWLGALRVAAVLVVGLVLGAGAVLGWSGGEPEPAPSASTGWRAPLLTADGRAVGAIARSYSTEGAVLVLEVTAEDAGKQLTCRLVHADGTFEDVAHWQLSDRGPNSWVLDTGDEEPAQVQLLDEDGEVWATAQL